MEAVVASLVAERLVGRDMKWKLSGGHCKRRTVEERKRGSEGRRREQRCLPKERGTRRRLLFLLFFSFSFSFLFFFFCCYFCPTSL